MHVAPKPANESQRLAALHKFEILDSLPSQAFDDITLLASTVCKAPIALISLVDAERQWFKSRVGLDVAQTSREMAFCSHAILDPARVMVVEDAASDARFHDNPLVREAPDVRFYAGAPIVTDDGYALGTVCVIDREARGLDAVQVEALRALSRLVVNLLEQDQQQRERARKAADEAMRRTERLTAIATQALDLKSFVDRDYIYRYVNQMYLDYWERKREDIEGKPVAELVGEQAFIEMVKPHLDTALGGGTVSYEGSFIFPTRGVTHAEVTYLPARDADGVIIGAVVRVHDIQRLKEREELLRATVNMLERKTMEQQRFIHIVSHDLREPINTIVNFSSLLSGELGEDLSAAARRYLRFVHGGGERMKLLLDDLVHLIQLENQAIDTRPVDLNRLMIEVPADLALAIARAGARVECGLLPVVAGDDSMLRIVLQNLVANGIKFARKGVSPVVRVDASAAGDWHEITVRDNGVGIPATHLDNIFDMFKRLHSRKEYEGTGLGLSICRRIAEMHGGRITAASEPGLGSCFTLYLPVPRAAQTLESIDA